MSFQFNSIQFESEFGKTKHSEYALYITCYYCPKIMKKKVELETSDICDDIFTRIQNDFDCCFFACSFLFQITNETTKKNEPFVWQRTQQLVLFDIPLLNCCSKNLVTRRKKHVSIFLFSSYWLYRKMSQYAYMHELSFLVIFRFLEFK